MLASPYLPFSSVTLYAQWTADVFIVTFDARGGTVSTHTATFTVGGSPVDLPTPRLAGRTFEGWYTASSGGQRVSGPLSPTSAETLFAQWSQKAPSSPTDLRSSRTKNQIIVRWSSDARVPQAIRARSYVGLPGRSRSLRSLISAYSAHAELPRPTR